LARKAQDTNGHTRLTKNKYNMLTVLKSLNFNIKHDNKLKKDLQKYVQAPVTSSDEVSLFVQSLNSARGARLASHTKIVDVPTLKQLPMAQKLTVFALASPMECGPELASLPLSTYHSANHEVDSVDSPLCPLIGSQNNDKWITPCPFNSSVAFTYGHCSTSESH
jgi:hypothetical protein